MNEIRADNGKTYAALAVDSISVLWQSLQPPREIDQRAWGVIKRQWHQFINHLTALPIPVILTAHEHLDEEKQLRPDAEKSILYWPDLALQLRADHSAVVRAARGIVMTNGAIIKSPSVKTILAGLAPKQSATVCNAASA